MTSDLAANSQRYLIHSRQYLENALLALQNLEAGKAGELLWGSVAEMVHAVAAYNNTQLHSHRELKNFVIQLARELNDDTIKKDFLTAESLHHNFYEVQQEPIDIEIVVPIVRELVNKLFRLLPSEANRQPIPPQ